MEHWINRLAKKPTMFKQKIIIEFDREELLEIYVPRLLKSAVEKFANRPMIAIYFSDRPVGAKK